MILFIGRIARSGSTCTGRPAHIAHTIEKQDEKVATGRWSGSKQVKLVWVYLLYSCTERSVLPKTKAVPERQLCRARGMVSLRHFTGFFDSVDTARHLRKPKSGVFFLSYFFRTNVARGSWSEVSYLNFGWFTMQFHKSPGLWQKNVITTRFHM